MARNSSLGCTPDMLPAFKITYIAVPLCLIIVCENILGMTIIWRTPVLHTNANRFIFSLALTDVSVAFTSIIGFCFQLPELMNLLSDSHILDRFLLGNSMTMILLSCIHMSIIAVDRYIYITKPFYYIKNATKKRVMIIICCTWIIGLTYHIIPFISYADEDYNDICIFLKPPLAWFVPIGIVYPVTFIIVFICYFKIARVAIRHKRAARARRQNITDLHVVSVNRTCRVAMMKSVIFFAVIFGVFFFCTSIPGIAITINRFHELPWSVTWHLAILYVINSGMNFPIYAYMSKDFSKALKKTLSEIFNYSCKKKIQV